MIKWNNILKKALLLPNFVHSQEEIQMITVMYKEGWNLKTVIQINLIIYMYFTRIFKLFFSFLSHKLKITYFFSEASL